MECSACGSHSAMETGCCVFVRLFVAGNLWTALMSHSFLIGLAMHLSSSLFLVLLLSFPFLSVIKMSLCCLAILSLKKFSIPSQLQQTLLLLFGERATRQLMSPWWGQVEGNPAVGKPGQSTGLRPQSLWLFPLVEPGWPCTWGCHLEPWEVVLAHWPPTPRDLESRKRLAKRAPFWRQLDN